MRKLLNWKVLFVIIILFAGLLRFWQLGTIPQGFHGDEAGYGYNAYSLLLTGKDEHGQPFPLLLQSWGDHKPALYAYLTIPWIALFDLNPFSVRITSALFGIFTVILLYFLTNKLFNNYKISLLASFLLAFSPWHLSLSRTTSEVVVSVFFILLLIYAGLYLREKFRVRWFAVALVSGILALGSYTAARFFVVVITGLLLLLSTGIVKKKIQTNFGLLILFVAFVTTGIFISSLDQASRFNQISIFSSPQTKLVLDEQIREDQGTPVLLTRVFHNKIVNYTRTILENYTEYFTIDYLFLTGGYPYREKIPASGLLSIWQLPFLLFGIYTLIKKPTSIKFFLIGWWVVLLLPASMTYDEIPNVYRSLVVLPPIIILTALGLYSFFSLAFSNKFFFRLMIIVLIGLGGFEFLYFQHQYYAHQEVHLARYRDYAYKPLMQELQILAPSYKKIIMTKSNSGSYIAVLFWNKYDPKTYQAERSPADKDFSGFGKYFFVPQECPLFSALTSKDHTFLKKEYLYVEKGECMTKNKNVKLLKIIYWQDNTAAFKILKYSPAPKKNKL